MEHSFHTKWRKLYTFVTFITLHPLYIATPYDYLGHLFLMVPTLYIYANKLFATSHILLFVHVCNLLFRLRMKMIDQYFKLMDL